ncbi:hypothetical protein HHI36_003414 [Cryptolaemus montrouzieri]|uniref:Uncharacterized protein n=1 Tax=Cryptolaemus montrouzieri TaxID=559131 RepID=A0ABD2PDV4_9CUCU
MLNCICSRVQTMAYSIFFISLVLIIFTTSSAVPHNGEMKVADSNSISANLLPRFTNVLNYAERSAFLQKNGVESSLTKNDKSAGCRRRRGQTTTTTTAATTTTTAASR